MGTSKHTSKNYGRAVRKDKDKDKDRDMDKDKDLSQPLPKDLIHVRNKRNGNVHKFAW